MRNTVGKRNGKKKRKGKGAVSVCLSAVSMVLLVALVLGCLPLTVPRIFGLHIYTVVSGSMEPAIPTGSLVYVRETAPEQVEAEEVIAFYGARDSASIITHRVVENRVVMGEFITKGDANQTEDMNPIPYENFIGSVVCSIPALGRAAELFTSHDGKLIAGAVILAALLMQGLAVLTEKKDKRQED